MFVAVVIVVHVTRSFSFNFNYLSNIFMPSHTNENYCGNDAAFYI